MIQHLPALNPDKTRRILWEGARDHRGEAVHDDLNEVNQNLEEENWKVTCLLFAPKAPDQNPVEEVGLRGKDFLRTHFYENKTLNQVKCRFFNFLNNNSSDSFQAAMG